MKQTKASDEKPATEGATEATVKVEIDLSGVPDAALVNELVIRRGEGRVMFYFDDDGGIAYTGGLVRILGGLEIAKRHVMDEQMTRANEAPDINAIFAAVTDGLIAAPPFAPAKMTIK